MNLWEERRRAAQEMKERPSLAESLPAVGVSDSQLAKAGLTQEQYQLLAQLPRATHFDMGVTENISISGDVARHTVTQGFPSDLSSTIKQPVPKRPGKSELKDSPTWLSTQILPYGAIRDVYLSSRPDAPFVIHIQDAHEVAEAQKNIGTMIQGLREERGISLVGLEGAQGGFALDPFRAFPDPEVNRGIADLFLREGFIGGPEYAGLTAQKPPLLWGVEDLGEYESNIKAFKDSIKYKPVVHAFLKELEREAGRLKARAYSRELQQFDQHFSAYKKREESLGDYVRYLLETYPDTRRGYTNLLLLTNALDWEESLDFKRVETERMELVELFGKRLSNEQLSLLVQQSLQYRLGHMGYGDYYRFLSRLCQNNGIDLDAFGQLRSYINYVLLAEQINRNDLLTELSDLEQKTQDHLAVRPDQKELVSIHRNLMMLEKMTSHNMTPTDWLYYDKNRTNVMRIGDQLNAVAVSLGTEAGLAMPANFKELIQPFEQFCAYAMQRNNSLVENLLTKMRTENATRSILVAGGFHSDGLTQILRSKDVSYVVVTPKISEVPKDTHYLDVFSHDPVPLEKLFSGEIINLKFWLLLASKIGDEAHLRLNIFSGSWAALQTAFLRDAPPELIQQLGEAIMRDGQEFDVSDSEEFDTLRENTEIDARYVRAGDANMVVVKIPTHKVPGEGNPVENAKIFLRDGVSNEYWDNDRFVWGGEVEVDGRGYITMFYQQDPSLIQLAELALDQAMDKLMDFFKIAPASDASREEAAEPKAAREGTPAAVEEAPAEAAAPAVTEEEAQEIAANVALLAGELADAKREEMLADEADGYLAPGPVRYGQPRYGTPQTRERLARARSQLAGKEREFSRAWREAKGKGVQVENLDLPRSISPEYIADLLAKLPEATPRDPRVWNIYTLADVLSGDFSAEFIERNYGDTSLVRSGAAVIVHLKDGEDRELTLERVDTNSPSRTNNLYGRTSQGTEVSIDKGEIKSVEFVGTSDGRAPPSTALTLEAAETAANNNFVMRLLFVGIPNTVRRLFGRGTTENVPSWATQIFFAPVFEVLKPLDPQKFLADHKNLTHKQYLQRAVGLGFMVLSAVALPFVLGLFGVDTGVAPAAILASFFVWGGRAITPELSLPFARSRWLHGIEAILTFPLLVAMIPGHLVYNLFSALLRIVGVFLAPLTRGARRAEALTDEQRIERVNRFVARALRQRSGMTDDQFEEFDDLIFEPLVEIYQSEEGSERALNPATWDAFRAYQGAYKDGAEAAEAKVGEVMAEEVNELTLRLLIANFVIREKEGNLFIERMRKTGKLQHLLDMAEATHTAYFTKNDLPKIGVRRDSGGRVAGVFLGGYLGLSPEEARRYITSEAYLERFGRDPSKHKLTLDDLVNDDALVAEFMNRVLEANGIDEDSNGLGDRVTAKDVRELRRQSEALKAEGKDLPVIINTLAQSWERLRAEAKLYENVDAMEMFIFDLQKQAVIDTYFISRIGSAMEVPEDVPMWQNPIYQRMNVNWRVMDWNGFDNELIRKPYLPAAGEVGSLEGQDGISIDQIKKDKDIFNKIYSRMEFFRLQNGLEASREERAEWMETINSSDGSTEDKVAAAKDYLKSFGLIQRDGSIDYEALERDHLAPLIAAKGNYGHWTEEYFQVTYDVLRVAQYVEEANLTEEEIETLSPVTHNDGYFEPRKNGEVTSDSPSGMISDRTNPFLGGTLRNVETGRELSDAQLREFLTEEGYRKYTARYREVGSKKFKLQDLVVPEKAEEFFRALGKRVSAEKIESNPLIINTLADAWQNLEARVAEVAPELQADQRAFLRGKQTAAIAQVKLGLQVNLGRIGALLGWQVEMTDMENALGISKYELLETLIMHALWLTNPGAQWNGKSGWTNEYDERMQELVRTTTDVMAGIERGDFESVAAALERFQGELAKDLLIVQAIKSRLPEQEAVPFDVDELIQDYLARLFRDVGSNPQLRPAINELRASRRGNDHITRELHELRHDTELYGIPAAVPNGPTKVNVGTEEVILNAQNGRVLPEFVGATSVVFGLYDSSGKPTGRVIRLPKGALYKVNWDGSLRVIEKHNGDRYGQTLDRLKHYGEVNRRYGARVLNHRYVKDDKGNIVAMVQDYPSGERTAAERLLRGDLEVGPERIREIVALYVRGTRDTSASEEGVLLELGPDNFAVAADGSLVQHYADVAEEFTRENRFDDGFFTGGYGSAVNWILGDFIPLSRREIENVWRGLNRDGSGPLGESQENRRTEFLAALRSEARYLAASAPGSRAAQNLQKELDYVEKMAPRVGLASLAARTAPADRARLVQSLRRLFDAGIFAPTALEASIDLREVAASMDLIRQNQAESREQLRRLLLKATDESDNEIIATAGTREGRERQEAANESSRNVETAPAGYTGDGTGFIDIADSLGEDPAAARRVVDSIIQELGKLSGEGVEKAAANLLARWALARVLKGAEGDRELVTEGLPLLLRTIALALLEAGVKKENLPERIDRIVKNSGVQGFLVESLKIASSEKTVETALRQGRLIAIDITDLFAEGREQEYRRLSGLLSALDQALGEPGAEESQSVIGFVVRDVNVSKAKMNQVLEEFPNISGLPEKRRVLVLAQEHRILVDTKERVASVREILNVMRRVGELRDDQQGLPLDLYALDKEKLLVDVEEGIVNLLIVLWGALVYNATSDIEKDINKALFIAIQA